MAEQGSANKPNDILIIYMKSKTTFQLDTAAAGQVILQNMVASVTARSGNAIASRAASIAGSISTSSEVEFKVNTKVGTIKRGKRAITKVSADFSNKRESYIAHTALAKAKDAGRLN